MTRQRIDKWLWCARFFKTRSLAAKACHEGRVRVTGQVIQKAHYPVRPGDVLTFALGPHIRVVRVAVLASRRGPAAEARGLYEDLAPVHGLATDAAGVIGHGSSTVPPGAAGPFTAHDAQVENEKKRG